MAPQTRRRHYACWVIVVDRSSCRPKYVRYANLLHRSTVGNYVMDCMRSLSNAIFVPGYLENLVASINFYHETCPDYPFRWKNLFLLCIADTTVHYSRRAEGVMMIIWRWFVRSFGRCATASKVHFIRSWRTERKRIIVRSTVREEIEWARQWVVCYFNRDEITGCEFYESSFAAEKFLFSSLILTFSLFPRVG